jgi:hypothetical protein
MKTHFLILFLLQLLMLSCIEKLPESNQVVDCYFQYEYINHAWGFSHSGFTVTPSGEVFSFDKSTPWVFAEKEKLSSADLKKNIEASLKIDTLVSKADIDRYQELAFYAVSGKLSEPVMRGADMGELICKIIIPDTSDPTGRYREVLLTENGDFDQYNLSPEAAVIAAWITGFFRK